MNVVTFSVLLFILPFFSTGDHTQESHNKNKWVPAGLVLPPPKGEETFSKEPAPLTIRIVNRGEKTVYLQGIRDLSKQGKVQLYFYHRGEGRGWKPYFDSLPCNLPTCRNLYSTQGRCGEGEPVVIRLGPKGTYNAVQEFQWGGLLYERSEALQEERQRRYCYKGWAPNRGQVRVEIEYSKSVSRDDDRKETMEGRDHHAIEFNLPASQKVYEISLNG